MSLRVLFSEWPRPWCLVAILALVSFATSQQGSDLGNYRTMSTAVQAQDLELLAGEVAGLELRAVTGVPYRHWSFGPPLFIATFESVINWFNLPFDTEQLIAIVCVTSFWSLVFMGLQKISDTILAVAGTAISFVGTELGFYSCYNALELMTLLPAGALFYEACKSLVGERSNTLVIGTATGMLLMFRPYLGAYAWAAMALALAHSIASCDSRCIKIKDWAFLCLPILLALWQIGTVNFWMTGDLWQSPYSFGDEQFRSFDTRSPHLVSVLFSPFHGAFVYCPLVGFGTVFNLLLLLQAISRRELRGSLFWGLSLSAIICNYYFAGCWYIWWMCGWFGNRNIYIAGLFASAATIMLMQKTNGKVRLLIAAITIGSTAWTFLLLQRGAQSYCNFTTMLAGLEFDFKYWFSPGNIAVLIFSAVLASTVVLRIRADFSARGFAAAACTLAFAFLADRVLVISPPLLPMVATIVLTFLAGFAMRMERILDPMRFLVPACFLLMIAMFFQLESKTRPRMRAYPDGLRFPEYDMLYNLDMIKGISCVESERHEMLQFLRRLKGEEWVLRYMEEDELREMGRPTGGVRNYKEVTGYRYL